jgi:hypothetical protein
MIYDRIMNARSGPSRPWSILSVLAVATFLTCPLLGATYEAGPGQAYTNLSSVPWMSLAAGDTVNVHYLPGGYHEIIMLSNSGS